MGRRPAHSSGKQGEGGPNTPAQGLEEERQGLQALPRTDRPTSAVPRCLLVPCQEREGVQDGVPQGTGQSLSRQQCDEGPVIKVGLR